jgi:ABC-2 type transport system permease protein
LLSAPISSVDIIVGKYLGSLGLQLPVVLMCTMMPLSLLIGGELDLGKLFANVLALSLLISAFAAIGLYMSSITHHPTVAAISTFGSLFLLWIIDWSNNMKDQRSELFEYLSILRHFQNLQSGLISSVDVCYFLLFIFGFLLLSVRKLEQTRLQK